MLNQEALSKISDDSDTIPEMFTVTISDWNAGTYATSIITGDVRFDIVNTSYPVNQNITLTN